MQGGDTQDQNLLQFFLNVVEFGMTLQEAAEAPNINSYQMRSSFGDARVAPGAHHGATTPRRPWVRDELRAMGYTLDFARPDLGARSTRSCSTASTARSGAASSNHGEDYGIGW